MRWLWLVFFLLVALALGGLCGGGVYDVARHLGASKPEAWGLDCMTGALIGAFFSDRVLK